MSKIPKQVKVTLNKNIELIFDVSPDINNSDYPWVIHIQKLQLFCHKHYKEIINDFKSRTLSNQLLRVYQDFPDYFLLRHSDINIEDKSVSIKEL